VFVPVPVPVVVPVALPVPVPVPVSVLVAPLPASLEELELLLPQAIAAAHAQATIAARLARPGRAWVVTSEGPRS
jgi:hypothetical protein